MQIQYDIVFGASCIQFVLILWYVQKKCIYWGEGKKIYVVTKRVKNTFCLVWGFSNNLSNEGGKWCIDM